MKRETIKKKISSLTAKFAALLLAALGCAGSAWGATVTTEAELRTAIANGGTVTLGGNIALTGGEIAVGTTVTLDLGTYTISSPTNVFRVAANGNFTVNADASNPGGISVPTNRCCVYTSYGWDPGAKTVVLNGGVFTGNCVFNWSETASQNIEVQYGFLPDGYGSGEKTVPTSVTINGGTFTGGLEDGNVGAYRCYYFTVNGGIFERGLDCADTVTGSFGVTTTCKAFFKGGKYRTRYPAKRTQDATPKVFIGTENVDYVYYIDGDYYVIAPDYSACEATACYSGACVVEVGWFWHLVTGCYQAWQTTDSSYRWYFLTYAQASSQGTDAQYVNGSAANGEETPGLTSGTPRLLSAAKSSARLLSAASSSFPVDSALPTATTDFSTSLAEENGFSDYDSVNFGGVEGSTLENLTNPDSSDIANIHYFRDRTDLDACRVLSYTSHGGGGAAYSWGTLVSKATDYMNGKTEFDEGEKAFIIAAAKAANDAGYNGYAKTACAAVAGWTVETFGSTKNYVAIVLNGLNNTSYVPGGGTPDVYGDWWTDVVVWFDRDVAADTVDVFLGIANYNDGAVVKSVVSGDGDAALAANTKYVLSGLNRLPWSSFTSSHPQLLLAVKNRSAANVGTTATVALRHRKDGEADVIRAYFTCAFSEEAVAAQLPNGVSLDGVVWVNEGMNEGLWSGLSYSDEAGNAVSYEDAYSVCQTTFGNSGGLRANAVLDELGTYVQGLDVVSLTGIGSDAKFAKYLSISVNGLQIKGVASATKSLGAIVFAVTPQVRVITTGETTSDTTRAIRNEELNNQAIKFRLPLTDDFTDRALVVHTSNDANYPEERWIADVGGEAGARYVEISTTHFSEFTVSPIGDDGVAYVTSSSGSFIGSYTTLADAIDAANDGDTVTLLKDSSGNGIKVLQGKFGTNGLTVDFAGHTYTMDGAMVGSTGTETQAFQLLKDNRITFKNGTIYSEKARILVQNYSDLTLDGMTLTLNNSSYNGAYTLSNNNGNIVIKDTTINANPAGGFAFDVCRYSSYPSVKVTVKGESKINGNVEVSASNSDAKDGFGLILESGTMTGEIVLDSSAVAVIGNDADGKTDIRKYDAFTKEAPAGYVWVADAKNEGQQILDKAAAKIGDTYYATLEAAIAAAVDGDTVTLLADSSGNGIKVPQGKFGTNGLTVDFAGHTYTMDGAMVGSTGTETQAFQLLKDNRITFKSSAEAKGVITSTKAKFLVQNYSDLTLDNMELTLNNANYTSAYTLSNNNGNIVIKDTTINANPAGGFAFDVCRYSSYPSVNVTVRGSSKINGDVEVSASNSDAKDGFSLALNSGTMTGCIVMDASASAALAATPDKATVYKSSDFTQEAPADYKWVETESEGVSKLVPKVYVVQNVNTEVKYETLQEAIDAAQDGETVKMLANEVLDQEVNADKTMTLDLNGYTVSIDNNANDYEEGAIKATDGTLTITDTSDEGDGVIRSNLWTVMADGGNIVVAGGNIESIGNMAIVSWNGDITISGGALKAKGNVVSAQSGSSVFITGGAVTATTGNVLHKYMSCDYVVSGGNFYAAGNSSTICYSEEDAGLLEITGGTFFSNNDNADANGCLEASLTEYGYELSDAADDEGYPWAYTVVRSAPVATVSYEGGETKTCYTLMEAIVAVNGITALKPVTVTLLRDATHMGNASVGINSGKTIVLDLAGYTVTAKVALNVNASSLTITGGGEFVGSDVMAVTIPYRASNVNLTLDGGVKITSDAAEAIGIGGSAQNINVTIKDAYVKAPADKSMFTVAASSATAATITAVGGCYSADPSQLTCVTIGSGYIVAGNSDAETKDAYPYTVTEVVSTGAFVYPIEGTAGLPIPSDWLADNNIGGYSDAKQPILATMTNAMVTALSGKADNGMPMWQSYVLGLTPNGANATALRLAATAKDATTVTISAAVNVPATLENSGTTVSFRLAEQNADGTWKDIEAGKASPSFDVSLDTVAGKVLTIFADIVTE